MRVIPEDFKSLNSKNLCQPSRIHPYEKLFNLTFLYFITFSQFFKINPYRERFQREVLSKSFRACETRNAERGTFNRKRIFQRTEENFRNYSKLRSSSVAQFFRRYRETMLYQSSPQLFLNDPRKRGQQNEIINDSVTV